MILPRRVKALLGDESEALADIASGDQIRDWGQSRPDVAFHPYREEGRELIPLSVLPGLGQHLWAFRASLEARGTFGGKTYRQAGRPWWEWHQMPKDSGAHSWALAFAFVATHNHFLLAKGSTVFKQSAPVIKLPEGATEDDHLRLLGVLNSSTACFWLKQVSHNKGEGGGGPC